jgi:hypothetical protein
VKLDRVTSLTGGYRNNNLLLEGDGGRWVLRSYNGTGRADVEAALAATVADLVPVARVLAKDPEGPSPLLEFVAGAPVDRLLPTLTEPDAVSSDARRTPLLYKSGACAVSVGPERRRRRVVMLSVCTDPTFVQKCGLGAL